MLHNILVICVSLEHLRIKKTNENFPLYLRILLKIFVKYNAKHLWPVKLRVNVIWDFSFFLINNGTAWRTMAVITAEPAVTHSFVWKGMQIQYKANFDPFARERMDNCNNSYSYTKPYLFGTFLWPIRRVWSIEQWIVFWWDVFETKYLKTCDQLFTILFPKFDQETMIKSKKSLICIQAATCNCCSGYLSCSIAKRRPKVGKVLNFN